MEKEIINVKEERVRIQNVYSKLQSARAKLGKECLKKSGKNTFSKYEYFELQDFLPQINKIFDEVGLCSMVNVNAERGNIVIIDTDNVDDRVMFTVPSTTVELKGCTDIQAIGAQQSYIKRYLYTLALEISESDMVDSTGVAENNANPPKGKSKGKPETSKKDDAETLDSVKAIVKAKCTELAKTKRTEVNETILKYHTTPNPSGIKDIGKLKELLEELNKL